MKQIVSPGNAAFNSFGTRADGMALPEKFTFPFDYVPHPLSVMAAELLQVHLRDQTAWKHNFGLTEDDSAIIGKMFGVLVVTTDENEVGYLAAFSGKLAGGNFHAGFVPPIFDGMAPGGFLNTGMEEISRINLEIGRLEEGGVPRESVQINELKTKRKAHSIALQHVIFDQYSFLNRNGEEKKLLDIFKEASFKNPPAGAGECAAPKLLQFAFQNRMRPLALAEFWWGASQKSTHWKHRHFYPCCREKCAPILSHMLDGMELEDKP